MINLILDGNESMSRDTSIVTLRRGFRRFLIIPYETLQLGLTFKVEHKNLNRRYLFFQQRPEAHTHAADAGGVREA